MYLLMRTVEQVIYFLMCKVDPDALLLMHTVESGTDTQFFNVHGLPSTAFVNAYI